MVYSEDPSRKQLESESHIGGLPILAADDDNGTSTSF